MPLRSTNLQESALKTSRAFDCEDYLSLNNAHGGSFIHSLCPITYMYLRFTPSSSIVLAVKIHLSPSSPREESLVHYAPFLHGPCTRQHEVNLRPTTKRDTSPRVDHLTGKTYLSPSSLRGESLVHCAALLYRCLSMSIPGVNCQSALHREARYAPLMSIVWL